jgi:hypothetical protein
MTVPFSPKAKLAVLAATLTVLSLAAYSFVAYLKDPDATDGCLAEYDACRGAGSGLTDALDCGIELYHCRALGEHIPD